MEVKSLWASGTNTLSCKYVCDVCMMDYVEV